MSNLMFIHILRRLPIRMKGHWGFYSVSDNSGCMCRIAESLRYIWCLLLLISSINNVCIQLCVGLSGQRVRQGHRGHSEETSLSQTLQWLLWEGGSAFVLKAFVMSNIDVFWWMRKLNHMHFLNRYMKRLPWRYCWSEWVSLCGLQRENPVSQLEADWDCKINRQTSQWRSHRLLYAGGSHQVGIDPWVTLL